MTESEIKRLRGLYCSLMSEVKARLVIVVNVLQTSYKLPRGVAFELCHLQFRMICELIAIACLSAHGDVPATSSGRMRSAYSADWIIKALAKLRPNFYPEPWHCEADEHGMVKMIAAKQVEFLTKPDLLKLYAESSTVLHRGTMKTIGPRTTTDAEWAQIKKWSGNIYRLVEEHVIVLSKPAHLLWVVLEDPKDGRCHAYDLEGRKV